MTKLATIEDLRTLLAKESTADLNNRFDTALEATTAAMAGILRVSDFDKSQSSYTAMYLMSYRNPMERTGGMDHVVYEVPRGFLVGGSLTMAGAGDLAGLTANPVDIDLANALVDTEKGYVTLFGAEIPAYEFVQLTYNAGFDVDPAEQGDVYTGVPDWLKTAAVHYAAVLYEAVGDINQDKRLAKMPALPDSVRYMLDPHRRFKQDTLRAF